ncbi:MAG TPA: alpha-glucan family phosphorylase, partial [Gammaproteobacteria bacterium]|nr:alpha-glucan family phosphorylase [Gammaproteobacteria bacterium]
YYSWNRRVRGLFRHLDQDCWDASSHNPKVFLRRIRQHRLDQAANDPILLAEYRHVLSAYDTYREQKPTIKIDKYLDAGKDLVAYFSAEYGFHESMPIYAGGLGILAADYCKAMSNLWVPFVGIGILYREGYFRQRIACDGAQIAERVRRDPCDLPVTPALDADGNEVSVSVSLPGRALELKVWLVRTGQIRLFLLDSDVPANNAEDRMLTAQLYGGDKLTRIQQEIILGIGGTRALRALGLEPTVWHINEGHAAFLILERCLEYVREGMDFESALELTAANTAFTTHTPVPAGHDVFSHQDMRTFFTDMIKGLMVTEERFLALGAKPTVAESFYPTALAMRGSRYRNGVSRIHGDIAAEMESYIWPGIQTHENPVGYVTNGADVDSYLAHSWVALFEMYMGGGWRAKITDKDFWENFIDQIPNHVFLSVRKLLKAAAIEEIRQRAVVQYERCAQTKSLVSRLTANLNTRNLDTLLIGFARRFATYKRAGLIFDDLERLARLVNDPERPLTLVFAGKAHPSDGPGQALLKRIYEISLLPEFQGNVILLEDYNLSMTRELLPGVDVWLNTPDYPMEACGTSGMKAAMNGAINLSVLDGWWAEAYDGENGWAITPHPEFDQETRNKWEAQELMNILEYQVIPAYYARNSDGEPEAWVARSKSSMKTILPQFNTIRMAMDYLRLSYSPAARQGRRMQADNQAGARELSAWKKRIADAWPQVGGSHSNPATCAICSGESLPIEVKVHLNGLKAEDIVVECLIGKESGTGEFTPHRKAAFTRVGEAEDGDTLFHFDLFSSDATCEDGGLQHYKIRLYPYHELLSHPLECGLMLWL